jgi:hypothetical protein
VVLTILPCTTFYNKKFTTWQLRLKSDLYTTLTFK